MVMPVCHISKCADLLCTVFNLHSLSCIASSSQTQTHVPGLQGALVFKLCSLLFVRNDGNKPHPDIFWAWNPDTPSKSHGSFCWESQFKEVRLQFCAAFLIVASWFYFVWVFLGDCLFFSSREARSPPAAIPGGAEQSCCLHPKFSPWWILGLPMCEHSRVLWCSLCTLHTLTRFKEYWKLLQVSYTVNYRTSRGLWLHLAFLLCVSAKCYLPPWCFLAAIKSRSS